MNRLATLSLSLLLLLGCEEEGVVLAVALQTDLVPVGEFVAVDARIEPHGGGVADSTRVSVGRGVDFITGQRVAVFQHVVPGRYLVTIELIHPDGRVRVTRVVDIVLEGNFAVTVIATRSCENIECGDGTTCSSGRCVDVQCSANTPELCPEPACEVPSDCDAPAAACAEARCVSGECFGVERMDSMCGPGQFCQPDTMCVGYPELPDAGPLDAGPLDAGVPDAGPAPDGSVPPSVPPTPARPVRGARIGLVSVGPAARVNVSTTGRPKFFWTRTSTAESFHVQVDDDPGFASPEINTEGIPVRFFRSAEASEILDPGKYYWRIAGCNIAGCSEFSDASHFWVGQVREDVDGSLDGIGAVVIGSPLSGRYPEPDTTVLERGEVATHVFSTVSGDFGDDAVGYAVTDANGNTQSRLGTSVAVGAFDATGALSLVSGAPERDDKVGLVLVFAGISDPMPQALRGGAPVEQSRFGLAVLVPGDLNGDGFDDLVVGHPLAAPGRARALVYWGSSTVGLTEDNRSVLLTPGGANDLFGAALGAVGDVNGDGFVDFAIGAPNRDSEPGRVYIYLGGSDAASDGVLESTRITLQEPTERDGSQFGFAIAGLDVDHDGYEDALIGAPGLRMDPVGGTAYIFFGGPEGLGASPPQQIVAPESEPGDRFGFVVAGGGDVDGNGLADFVIAAPYHSRPMQPEAGRVWLYRPLEPTRLTPAFPPTPSEILPSSEDPTMHFGSCLALSVDRTGDGHADVLVGARDGLNRDDPGTQGTGFVDIVFGTSRPSDPPMLGTTIYGFSDTHEYWYTRDFGFSCL